MKANTLTVRDSFVVNALRNCGYNNVAAIADIIDNSIEPDVDATSVQIELQTDVPNKGGTIRRIVIKDNGCGMDYNTLEEAMCLGSMTGKTGEANLGVYGAGLKTAALSMGKCLDVYTKIDDTDYVSHASLDITAAAANSGPISLHFNQYDYESYSEITKSNEMFGDFEDGHGTIVVISELDHLSNSDRKNFGGYLRVELGKIFGKFITSDICSFYVDAVKVEPVDMVANTIGQSELLGSGEFSVDDKKFSYRAFFVPKDDSTDPYGEGKKRNIRSQGIYIYRQNRLVGRGLSLGLWKKHPSYNGLYIELFVNGTCDALMGSTFTKIVNEHASETMSQSLKDTILQNIGPFLSEVKRRNLREAEQNKKATDPETQKMYENATKELNDNLLLKVNRRGENKPKDPAKKKERKHRGPQEHPPMFRDRKNKWIEGIKEISMGKNADMFEFELSNNKCTVLINNDHAFYTEFYNRLPIELKHQMAKIIACQEIAKRNVNYYNSDDVQDIVDKYNETTSTEVGKALDK